MDQKSDLIKEDIEETRAALTEKLETLEDQLMDKVETAKESVEDTIENVRATLRKVSPTHQVQQHPFVMIGGSLAAGMLVGKAIQSRSARAKSWERDQDVGFGEQGIPRRRIERPYSRPRGPSLLSKLAGAFPDEIDVVKGMALSLALEGLREIAKEALPRFEAQINKVVDSAAQKAARAPRKPESQEEGSGRRVV